MSHIHWPEITSFHNVRKCVENYPHILRNSVVHYRPKVKLHGINAAIQIRGDKVFAQSRTQLLGSGSDLTGFGKYVSDNKEKLIHLANDRHVIIFGEWAGPGVQKGVGISSIENKVFAAFAMMDLPVNEESIIIADPEEIEGFLCGVPYAYTLPWFKNSIEIPLLESKEIIEPILDSINEDVDAIEQCDPWVKSQFNVEGIGEGLVYYPLEYMTYSRFGNLCFKAKGAKHKIVSKQKPAQLSPEMAESVDAFAELVLTEARLEQGVQAASKEGKYDFKLIGPFLGWICKDVEKETQAELHASNLTWKDVSRSVTDKARLWYVEQVKKL